jgi:hypothetical protein
MSGIAFLGHIVVGNNFRAAECQAQWAVAYLDGQLSLPSKEEMEREVAMSVAWSRRRYLTRGDLGHWLYFDLVPYTDALLEQLGLGSHRRKNKWKDFFSPCVAEDLKDLFSELREKQRADLTEADIISNYSSSKAAMLLAPSCAIEHPLFARWRQGRNRTYVPAPPRSEMTEIKNASTVPMRASRICQKRWLAR